MALDKGAITDSHVLVLPIEHFPSSLHLSASAFAEMERYLSALRTCFGSQVLHLLTQYIPSWICQVSTPSFLAPVSSCNWSTARLRSMQVVHGPS